MTFDRALEIAWPFWRRVRKQYPHRYHAEIESNIRFYVWEQFQKFDQGAQHTSVEGGWYKYIRPNVLWAISRALKDERRREQGTTQRREGALEKLMLTRVTCIAQPVLPTDPIEAVLENSHTWATNATVRAYIENVVLGDQAPGDFYREHGVHQSNVSRVFRTVATQLQPHLSR